MKTDQERTEGVKRIIAGLSTIELAIVYAISEPVERMSKRMVRVPDDFSNDDIIAESIAFWAKNMSALLVTPEDAKRAVEHVELTGRFFPGFDDIMKEACGEDWATRKLRFPTWTLVIEEVIDLSTGNTVEIYPAAYPSVKLMTRLEVKERGRPDPDGKLKRIQDYYADGRKIAQEARRLSKSRGYQIAGGELSMVRKPNIPRVAVAVKEPEQTCAPDSNVSSQIERLRAMTAT